MAFLTVLPVGCRLPHAQYNVSRFSSFQISSELRGPVKRQRRDLQPPFKNSISLVLAPAPTFLLQGVGEGGLLKPFSVLARIPPHQGHVTQR